MQKRLRAEKCALIAWTDGMAQVLTVVPWVLFDKFDNLGKAQAGLVQVPVLCAHATDDEIVPFSQGVALESLRGARRAAGVATRCVQLCNACAVHVVYRPIPVPLDCTFCTHTSYRRELFHRHSTQAVPDHCIC